MAPPLCTPYDVYKFLSLQTSVQIMGTQTFVRMLPPANAKLAVNRNMGCIYNIYR